MRHLLLLMLGLTGILSDLCAQEKKVTVPAEKTFYFPPAAIDRRFRIDLGKGNHLILEADALASLDHFTNIDSLLLVFISDTKLLRDSLSDPLTTKNIDYLVDTSGRKKIRISQTRPQATTFLLDRQDLALLKLEQDTVTIMLAKPLIRATFYLNQWSELESYVAFGLNDKVRLLRSSKRVVWTTTGRGPVHLGADPAISAGRPGGYVQDYNDYIKTLIGANIQNYQRYFVPSFSLGLKLHVSNRIFRPNAYSTTHIGHELGLAWEPNFFFATNAQGHLQTYRNDFVTVFYAFDFMTRVAPPTEVSGNGLRLNIFPVLSFGWLTHREGEFMEKNTFRLGLGRLKLNKDKLSLEPGIYFHDFFKTVTPGLKLSLLF